MMSRRRQAGISYTGVLLLLLLAGLFIKVAAGIGPAYYDYYTIDKIISSLYRDGRINSIDAFKSGLNDRFNINQIRDKSANDFVYSTDSGGLVVELDYEVRSNLFGNLDLVAHFKKTYSSDQF